MSHIKQKSVIAQNASDIDDNEAGKLDAAISYMPNEVVNGMFDIWQRYLGIPISMTGAAVYVADRFRGYCLGTATGTMERGIFTFDR